MKTGKELNNEMNNVYEAVSEACDLVAKFYLENVFCNNECGQDISEQFADLLDKISNAKEVAHELAEHYTWDQ